MNNCFAYDLVPTVEVIESMIRAARRFDDFPTAVRAIEAVSFKVEKRSQYDAYVEALSPLMTELGESLRHLGSLSWVGGSRDRGEKERAEVCWRRDGRKSKEEGNAS